MWNLYTLFCPSSSVVFAHPEPVIPSQLHGSEEGIFGWKLREYSVEIKVCLLCLRIPPTATTVCPLQVHPHPLLA